MNKRKLFVAGCSVSDYTKVDKVYGDFLSEKLNFDYIHVASGCGSNWRMWRNLVNYIIDGKLTSNDLLIVQYTSLERKEFWSINEQEQFSGRIQLRERYKNGGDLIKYKMDAYTWQPFDVEKKFFNLYENNFINYDYEKEVFITQNLMFQTLLKDYNIPTVFFNFAFIEFKRLDIYLNNLIDVEEIRKNPYYFLENDMGHFNVNGHEYVANKIYNFLKTINFNFEKKII